jgi:hypothetical protein
LFNTLSFLSPAEDTSLSQKKKVTVEDLFSEDFKIHDPEAKWISSKSIVLRAPGRASHSHLLSITSVWMTLPRGSDLWMRLSKNHHYKNM